MTPEYREWTKDGYPLIWGGVPREDNDKRIIDDTVIMCDCSCHKTIEQGGAVKGDCVHCRILGNERNS